MTLAPSPRLIEHLRQVLRRLRREPGYTLPAVGVLGLGLGVLAATYTVLQQAVLAPLPVEDQGGVVVAWTDHVVRGFDHYPVTPALFEAVEEGGVAALSRVAAVGSSGTSPVVVEGTDGPRLVAWARTLGDFFGVLGTEPRLGRALLASDDVPEATEMVAVISDGYWERAFGRSPTVLGKVLRARSGSFTIVGVMPPDFDYPSGAEVWAPTRAEHPEWSAEPPRLELDLLGRLAPGASGAQVATQLAALSVSTPELEEAYRGTVPVVRAFDEHVLGPLAPTLAVLFAGGVLVLLVATLDLLNMVLVRMAADRGRQAVRTALGMSPRWLVVEAVVEGVALAMLGGALGAALGGVGVRAIVPLAPPALPRLDGVQGLDPSAHAVLVLGAAVAVAIAVVIPGWRAAHADLQPTRARGGGHSSPRPARILREGVVAGQVSVAVWVLVVGALLVRTVLNLGSLDPGFTPERLTLVQLDHASGSMLAAPGDRAQLAAALERIEGSGAVQAATPLQMPPLPGNAAWQTVLRREAQTNEEALEENEYLFMEFVEHDFASILDTRVVAGRTFDATDGDGAAPVLVVNESAARLYWPGQDAVGQRVVAGLPGIEGVVYTVAGVVADTRYGSLTELEPTVYFPFRQTGMFGPRYLLVRSTGLGAPLLDIVREALRAEAPGYRAVGVSSVAERLAEPLARPRFAAILVTLLAVAALLIALVGVYSTMAVMVRSRGRELGVRLACGGTPAQVGGLVIRRGVLIAAIGAGVGASAAVLSGGLVRSLLFGVSPGDGSSLMAGVGLVLACSALACTAPALRAASTDPALVLRSD